MALKNKSDLREMNEYRNVFRVGCLEGREREEASNDSENEDKIGAEREDGSNERKKLEREKSTVKLVCKNVRKIRTREKQIELEVWMKTNECDVCAINETGLNGNEYVEVSDEYKWIGTNID